MKVTDLLPRIAENKKQQSLAVTKMPNATLGDRMEAARTDMGLTKADLARHSGISRQNIGHIAHGSTVGKIAPETLFKIADALDVNARWLAFGTGPMKRESAIDVEVLAQLLADVTDAAEHYSQAWSRIQLARIAVRLYGFWEKSGELPDVDQSVQLLSDQR